MKLKVCGNTDLSQLKELNDLGIDYAGLIFYEQSPRYVLKKLSGKEVKDLNLNIEKTGVFVNAGEDEIRKQVDDFDLDIVQLHGDETASFCNRISDHVKVIKAFRIADYNANIDWLVKEYEEACDYYLFDKGSAGLFGGTGEKFDWELLKNNKINKPFFLSGGIGLDDIEKVKSFSHPFLYGLDINSKVETAPGVKDMKKIKSIMKEIKI